MRIPSRFKLLGQTIEVVYDEELCHRDGMTGCAEFRKSRIVIQPSTECQPRTAEHTENTFCHELMHFIFDRAAYQYNSDKNLNDQEGLVEMCGSLLHQALSTMEYAE